MVLTVADLNSMHLLEMSGGFANGKINLSLILSYVHLALIVFMALLLFEIFLTHDFLFPLTGILSFF